MHIETIRLFQFRNLRDSQYSFEPGVQCIVGENGQGKTNLIEAISLLSLTRSFRTASLHDLIRWGEHSCSVFAHCIIKGEARELGISIADRERKTFIDGKEATSVTSLVGNLLCISFSPTDISLIKGSPQGRRRFIDRHVVDLQPELVKHYLSYQRALKSKQAALKQGTATRQAIEVWNEVLIPSAVQIINGRLSLVRMLEARIGVISERLFGDATAISLRLGGASGTVIRAAADEPVSVHEVARIFVEAQDKELTQQRALVGPHRDDLGINLFGKDTRAFASQGQSRSIVLGLKLALIELFEALRHDTPIVLLDDVDSELDRVRRQAIFGAIFDKPRQIFITATEFRLPEELADRVSKVLELTGGELRSTAR
ncbi:MAG: DNA replication and repair protein RecF [Proteobacteria bacterium]|nr:DNA replication and repair protein RecF [Pseudomonadota bacterium]